MTEIYQILRLGSELHLHLGKRRVCRIYSLEAQFVQRQAKSIFQGAPLRCALGLRQSGVESCHAYPALSDTTPRETRGGVARTGLLSAVPLCGTGAIMVRVYRQPDERLSTQRPERLTRTFNYTLCQLCSGLYAGFLDPPVMNKEHGPAHDPE